MKQEIEKIIRYPKEIEGDKIACMVWDSLRGVEGLTKTSLHDLVLTRLISEVSRYKDVSEVIDKLMTKGLLEKKVMNKPITIISQKTNGENYVTGNRN